MASAVCDYYYCKSCKQHHDHSRKRKHDQDQTFTVKKRITDEEGELQEAVEKVSGIVQNLLRLGKKQIKVTTLQHKAEVFSYVREYEEVNTMVEELVEKTKIIRTIRYKEKLRIASWNLHENHNSDCIQSMCWTINNYDFDIVALQEVGQNAGVADQIVERLKDFGQDWKCQECTNTNIAGVIIWKSQRCSLNYKDGDIVDDDDFHLGYGVGLFKIQRRKFAFVNFHLAAISDAILRSYGDRDRTGEEVNELEQSHLHDVLSWVSQEYKINEKNVILLGDFNSIPQDNKLDSNGFSCVFDSSDYTNALETKTYDNIILHSSIKWIDHGVAKTYNKDGTAIVRKKDAKKISDHLAVWVDIEY